MGNFFERQWFKNIILSLLSFLIIFIISLSCPVNNIAQASNIDDQTLSKIRVFLNIPVNEVSDERLRDVLNKEIETGISLGEHIGICQ